MRITKDWIEELCKKYGVKPKFVRDSLWPDNKNRSLGYFDQYVNVRIQYMETIADALGCTVDEVLRRPRPAASQFVTGDNNQIGNFNISNDVETLNQIIEAQKQIITHQDEEIKRLNENMKSQLEIKDQQINRLIKLAKGEI